jgi:hypothetical protein
VEKKKRRVLALGEEEARGNFYGGWRARTLSLYSAREPTQ